MRKDTFWLTIIVCGLFSTSASAHATLKKEYAVQVQCSYEGPAQGSNVSAIMVRCGNKDFAINPNLAQGGVNSLDGTPIRNVGDISGNILIDLTKASVVQIGQAASADKLCDWKDVPDYNSVTVSSSCNRASETNTLYYKGPLSACAGRIECIDSQGTFTQAIACGASGLGSCPSASQCMTDAHLKVTKLSAGEVMVQNKVSEGQSDPSEGAGICWIGPGGVIDAPGGHCDNKDLSDDKCVNATAAKGEVPYPSAPQGTTGTSKGTQTNTHSGNLNQDAKPN